jgi:hypothetical protein
MAVWEQDGAVRWRDGEMTGAESVLDEVRFG